LSDFITINKLTLKRLLCTHLHLDHIFGNAYIYKTYGLKPEAHKMDVEMIPSLSEQVEPFGIKRTLQDVVVEKYISGNEVIRFGTSELLVLTVPGHSPGSVAFYSKKDGFVIVGDALFAGSIGRTDLWGGNQDILLAAIRDKLLSLPEQTLIYPGHGPETSVIDETLNNPYL
ncbi:MAG: MBL fold metallo-hydrolase, partial [Tannerellaceae bacterium]